MKYKKIRLKKIFFFCVVIISACSHASTKTLKSFGANANGIVDDSFVISKALLSCQNGDVVDGEGLVYLLENEVKVSLKQMKLINCKFILGKTYNKQGNFSITSDFVVLDNIFVDGGRNTYVKDIEKWTVFNTENNTKSICPNKPDFFLIYGIDKSSRIELNNFTVQNLHAFSAVTIYSYGKVILSNLNFQNNSYKTFHVYHSTDDGKTNAGETHVSNAYAKNVGILSTNIQIDGKKYNRSQLQMMPQASFNFIVSFGNYYAHNLEVMDYGSTAVTADRNEYFTADSIKIKNNTKFAFSNNPSGGMWFEKCANVEIKKLNIKIVARDKRDSKFDSSAMHIYSVDGKVTIDDLTIESGSEASLNKGLRGSLSGRCDILIKNFKLSGNYKSSGAHFAILDDRILSTINIDRLDLKSENVDFYGIKNVIIGNVNGVTGSENLNFILPFSNDRNNENYEIKKSNLRQININKNVTNIRLNNQKTNSKVRILN